MGNLFVLAAAILSLQSRDEHWHGGTGSIAFLAGEKWLEDVEIAYYVLGFKCLLNPDSSHFKTFKKT